MNRYKRLESARVIVDEMLLAVKDAEDKRHGYVHLYGVSGFAAMLARKRLLNPEIAAIAGIFHDYYFYKTGIREFHDQNSAEAVRPIIRDMGVFTKEEQQTILCAIFYHSDKSRIHGVYDELLKDADVLQHYFYNVDQKVRRIEAGRLKKIVDELALPGDFEMDFAVKEELDHEENEHEKGDPASITADKRFLDKRKALADFAEAFASKGIVGVHGDQDYRVICRYWPDKDICQALKEGWCAAFVYYCCRKAGFLLPIRYPNGIYRLAGVGAWLEWAQLPEVDFYHSFQDSVQKGFTPQRGDIVIYEKLITDEAHDHIGIVLSCEENHLLVAEGNMDNKNKSRIVVRDRWDKIKGFVRIDNNYEYQFSGEYYPRLD